MINCFCKNPSSKNDRIKEIIIEKVIRKEQSTQFEGLPKIWSINWFVYSPKIRKWIDKNYLTHPNKNLIKTKLKTSNKQKESPLSLESPKQR